MILGSILFYWRWPEIYQTAVRDGLAVTLLDKPEVFWRKSRLPEDPAQLEAMRKKIKRLPTKDIFKQEM